MPSRWLAGPTVSKLWGWFICYFRGATETNVSAERRRGPVTAFSPPEVGEGPVRQRRPSGMDPAC